MEDRKAQLLKLVIENYIETAEPVGSQFLIETSNLGVSAATVRNVMRELEDEGYLTHPHTSAGRIPTEAGYQFYIRELMTREAPKKKVQEELRDLHSTSPNAVLMKVLAKYIAEEVEGAVIVAIDKDQVFYTGLSHIMAQPEFREMEHTIQVSQMFDQCEEVIADIFAKTTDVPVVLVGSQNPFGESCGIVSVSLGNRGLIAIVGPMRMAYGRDVSMLEYLQQLIS